MANPESSMTPGRLGARPGGGGVRGLLAMFEKGAQTPATPPPQINRELSPGPKPLGRVRTSFVAIGAKEGLPGVGLQRLPDSPAGEPGGLQSPFGAILRPVVRDLPSPVKSEPDFRFEDPAKKEAGIAKEQEKPTETGTTINETPKLKPTTPWSVKVKEAEKEKGKEKEKTAPKELAKKDALSKKEEPSLKADVLEPKSVAKVKPTPAIAPEPALVTPRANPKFSEPRNLDVPVEEHAAPRSPRKISGHLRNHSTSSVPKMRPMSMPPPASVQQPRSKPNMLYKPIPKPEAKEATKPAELKGSAFMPTASWVAKHGGALVDANGARRSPTLMANARADGTLRRQKSNLSDHTRELIRQPQRPATSAAYVGFRGRGHYTMPSSDFLNRMTRPTKSSMSKVHYRAERSGSSIGRSSVEPSLSYSPTRNRRVSKRMSLGRDMPTFRLETQRTEVDDNADESIPEERGFYGRAPTGRNPHHSVPKVSTYNSRGGDMGDEGHHTPTTTSSQATLVGEASYMYK